MHVLENCITMKFEKEGAPQDWSAFLSTSQVLPFKSHTVQFYLKVTL